MTLEYHDTMVPEHQYANIGNDTVMWDDGWFSDTVHARRFEGEIFEGDGSALTGILKADGSMPLTSDWTTGAHSIIGSDHWYMRADYAKMFFGTGDDASIFYSGSNLQINPREVGTGGLVMPLGSQFAIGVGGGISTTQNIACDIYRAETDLTKSGAGIKSDYQFGPTGAGNTTKSLYAFYYRMDTNPAWTGDALNISGAYGIFRHQGTGAVQNAYGAWYRMFIRPDAGDIVNGHGLKIEIVDESAVGAYTNTYGVQIVGAGLGTATAFAFHSDGGVVYSAGSVGINALAPDEKLEVHGNIHLDDDYKMIFGTGKDASIYYSGSNLVLNPLEVGTGGVVIWPGGRLAVGVGISTISNYGCQVYYENTDLAKFGAGVYSDLEFGPVGAGDTTRAQDAVYCRLKTNAAWTGNQTGSMYGYRGIFLHYGSGTIADAHGVYYKIHIGAGGGDITNGYGIKVDFEDISSVGAFTNTYGVKIAGAGLASGNAFAFHSDGGVVYSAGSVGIGVAAPDEKLQVAGNIHVDDNNKVILGDGKDAAIYYNATNLIIDPDEAGSGKVLIGATADDEIDAGSYSVGGAAGASGSFTTVDSKTVTVTNGIITSIV